MTDGASARWCAPTPMVERDHELSVLRSLLAEALTGRGWAAVVDGPVATGKSQLLHTFCEYAEDQDALVLRATASHAERTLPLGVVGQLIRGADLPPETAERVYRLLDEGAHSARRADPEGGPVEPALAHVLRGLGMALQDLADRRPVVLAIDDVHHADLLSLQCLASLVRRIPSSRMLIVLTETTRPQPTDPLVQAELLRQPHCRRLRLGTLSRQGVEQLLAQRLSAQMAAGMATGAHAVSGGNPLLVSGLVADHLAGPANALARSAHPARSADRTPANNHPLTVGANFCQALMGCLYRAEPTMFKVVRGLAVLGEPADSALLGQLAGLPAKTAREAQAKLAAAGILDSGWFRHPAAPAAVLDATSPEELADLHARAASLLHTQGANARAVATHLVSGAQTDEPWVAPVLRDAADLALADGELTAAADFLALAQRTGSDAADRAATQATLAAIEWRVNPSIAMRHVCDLTAAVRARDLTGPAALVPINLLLWFGRTEEALNLMELSVREPLNDPQAAEDRAAALIWLSLLYPSLGERSSRENPDHQAYAANPCLKAVCALRDVLRGGDVEAATAAAEQVLYGSVPGEREFGQICAALGVLIYGDRLSQAARWCDLLMRDARTRHVPTWRALLATFRGEIALRTGDLADARQHANDALSLISARDWGVAIGGPLGTVIQACVALGRYDEAATHLRIPVPAAMFQTAAGAHYLIGRGRYFHATERYPAALADFQSVGDMLARWRLEYPAFESWWSDAAQSCLRLGRRRQARELVLAQLNLLGPGHHRARGISLRVMAATCPPKERPGLLSEAVDSLRQAGDRLELAHALGALGQGLQELGRADQARTLLRQAHQLAATCGAEPLRRALPPEIGSAPPLAGVGELASDDATGLSEAELRVAALAAKGYTNRKIADQLFVTVSTVEQHLTRVYRKLNVRRRTDLPRRLADSVAS